MSSKENVSVVSMSTCVSSRCVCGVEVVSLLCV